MRNVIQSAKYPSRAGMSWGVSCDKMVFLAGTAPIDDAGQLVGADDAEIQARVCFASIGALLEIAGTDMTRITKLTCYATSKAAAFSYIRVKAELFPEAPPACTTVIVSELLLEGMMLEIDATAMLA